MSRDIFVQDIPASVRSVDEIPEDWMPSPLAFTAAAVIDSAKVHSAGVDDSDPSWIRITEQGLDIELSLADETPLMSFAIHDRSSDRPASDRFIAGILADLGARAFDPEGSDSGIFEASDSSPH
ncbi:hypothetical protein [Aeromicrobium sp.]|uniref:hypothetical protein n=1 Tax=Aeromicrobium sp. TaxID=1871063 RepID=UPI002FC9C2DD